ncbi:MAG: hypothetical protein HY308_00730 [Gammaproteobacteria bacterium]|nr:hypothetical protein [Gammaproteobacteria bacterium]
MGVIVRNLVAVSLMLIAGERACAAGQDSDLDSIPDALLSPTANDTPTETPTLPAVRWTLRNTVQYNAPRSVDFAPAGANDDALWAGAVRVTAHAEQTVSPNWRIVTDGFVRADMIEARSPLMSENLVCQLRETYVDDTLSFARFFSLGRLNVKNGVAQGFNPTDYLRRNTSTDTTARDARERQNERLGSLMVRYKSLWDDGAFSIALLPRINARAGHWWTDADVYGQQFDRTNPDNALLLTVSRRVGADGEAQPVLFYEDDTLHLGFNYSATIGNSDIAYVEWSGARRAAWHRQALTAYCDSTTTPPAALQSLCTSGERRFRSQLAAGIAHSTASDITTHIEYHYNELGLTDDQWDAWVTAAETASMQNDSAMLGALWSMRRTIQDNQDTLPRHSLFIRTHANDFLTADLGLTLIGRLNLQDRSRMLQLGLDYVHTPSTTSEITIAIFTGDRRSEFGSVTDDFTLTYRLNHHF